MKRYGNRRPIAAASILLKTVTPKDEKGRDIAHVSFAIISTASAPSQSDAGLLDACR